jgi:cyclic pyranopterin phosphate synthase
LAGGAAAAHDPNVKRARLPVFGESRRARSMEIPERPRDFVPGRVLADARARTYSYARISVTDRCDMACVYCMPPGGEAEHGERRELLSDDEIVRLVGVLASYGVTRIRLTGGEPLVRRDLPALVARITAIGSEVVLTTNASLLTRHASALRAAGLAGVNVSIDTLDADRFERITRGGSLAGVLTGIDAALTVGLRVKTNTVVLGGMNDDELPAIVEWAWARGITPRFIELMPIGEGATLSAERFVPFDRMRASLAAYVDDARGVADHGAGPARYLAGRDGRIGFITATSDEFCGTCNRVRITSHGELRGCLADRAAVSLRDAMRNGASDDDLAWSIAWSLGVKTDGHAFTTDATEHTHVGMSLIGG